MEGYISHGSYKNRNSYATNTSGRLHDHYGGVGHRRDGEERQPWAQPRRHGDGVEHEDGVVERWLQGSQYGKDDSCVGGARRHHKDECSTKDARRLHREDGPDRRHGHYDEYG
ncbi:hypothetical protein CJ030_MR2G004959 [Morella rubra]|uniref:Uncharacterized protein n=1 Tax=Morella rubra TaxID=262757 RepID=A0A6A1WL38_9ROSI|nr:hypothetical protein CJ030_MR2G004959 [Morella rubra]